MVSIVLIFAHFFFKKQKQPKTLIIGACGWGGGLYKTIVFFYNSIMGMQTYILGVSKVSKFSSNESKRFIVIRNFELERHGI
jgi:hypothetical protein